MSAKPRGTSRLRAGLWALGTLVCLGWYATQEVRLPHRTSVGVEHPLLRAPGLEFELHESPAGGRWMFTTKPEIDPNLQPTPPPPPPTWPRMTRSPRLLTFWEPAGTWEMTGSGLHRVWRYDAHAWDGDHQLWGTLSGDPWEVPSLRLDLRTGRTWVEDEMSPFVYSGYEEVSDPFQEEPDLTGSLGSPLESVPNDLRPDEQRRYRIGDRRVHLLWSTTSEPAALYAASDEAAPRLLRLTQGTPVELSADGKTLFFTRSGTLWRLDLRKPLPELLDEVPLPTLPEPPLE